MTDDQVINLKKELKNNTIGKFWDKSSVDFVLAYEHQIENDQNLDFCKIREIFEDQLRLKGVDLETYQTEYVTYTLIHVPVEILKKYAAVLKLSFPINIKDEDLEWDSRRKFRKRVGRLSNKLFRSLGFSYNPRKFGPINRRLRAEYVRGRQDLFGNDEDESFFNSSVRATVASYIVDSVILHDGIDKRRGISGLLDEGVYTCCYPLHEEHFRSPLYEEWAKISNFRKVQPLHHINEYLGAEVALYFAWKGFYIYMLLFASLVGILCFLTSILSYKNEITEEICNSDVIMCPRCDITCDYWRLSDSCVYAKLEQFVDNPSTIAFSIFMAIWAAVYLELWKRYSAGLIHDWGLTYFSLQAMPPRDAYIQKVTKYSYIMKKNPVTRIQEPRPSFWKVKLPYTTLSYFLSNIWIVVTIIAVVSIIVYRMAVVTSYIFSEKFPYFVTITTPIMNLVVILGLQTVYDKLAKRLTELELNRTQTEFDNSLSLKMYIFQFINFYSSIFYIAFFKGKFVGSPVHYNRFFGIRQEECNPGGCLMELTIQLAIIMTGKQFFKMAMELNYHKFKNCWSKFKSTSLLANKTGEQWEQDFLLDDPPEENYIEMVLQYGFVTIFVTAFPLAPLFALLYNIFELRKNALNYVKYGKRPVPRRVARIGLWFYIIEYVSKLSILTNALILAFTSNFIPKLLFKLNHHNSEKGFVNVSLSYFNVSDFQFKPIKTNYPNVTECRYSDYRYPYWHANKYELSEDYWHVLAFRLAFIVIYQNVINLVADSIDRIIPDKPAKLKEKILRETYTINEFLLNSA